MNSYKFGKSQEGKILPHIRDFFQREIKAYSQEFSKYDFYDDRYNYELKSRTVNKRAYPTTMITFNKLETDKPLILLFNFKDKLCYIEYNVEQFSKYEKQMFSRAGLSYDEKEHIFIPIGELKDIPIKPPAPTNE
jgi:hypothetical protein